MSVDDSPEQEIAFTNENLYSNICSTCYEGDIKDSSNDFRSQELFSWAFQVARGMEFISQKKVIF